MQASELSYEELCAAHTEARMAAAAAAEVQTELAARVSGWRSKIAPVLEEQDARGNFDIHTCAPRAVPRSRFLCYSRAGLIRKQVRERLCNAMLFTLLRSGWRQACLGEGWLAGSLRLCISGAMGLCDRP